jgi:predicted transcriptional regulator
MYKLNKKNQNKLPKLLTDVELELMNILWKIGQGTVHEVIECLPNGRNLAYTSVSTILRILEQKKFVRSRKEGRGHIYCPILQKQQYEGASLQHLVTKVFDGTPTAVVRRLLEVSDLSDEELKSIRSLLNERLQ